MKFLARIKVIFCQPMLRDILLNRKTEIVYRKSWKYYSMIVSLILVLLTMLICSIFASKQTTYHIYHIYFIE